VTTDRGLSVQCKEVVELVTDYLEGRLDEERRLDVEAHLALCDPCIVYIEQMRQTIRSIGYVPLDTLSDDAKSTLLDAFRARTS
jgi:anti-sigma factor RsiW